MKSENSDEYVLLDPFYIDQGELGRMPPEEAFTLGVEWATLRLILDSDPSASVSLELHTKNVERITKLCSSRGREVSEVTHHDDGVYSSLVVEPKPKNVLRLIRG